MLTKSIFLGLISLLGQDDALILGSLVTRSRAAVLGRTGIKLMVKFAGDIPEGLEPPKIDFEEVEPTVANLGGPTVQPADLVGEIQLEELEADTSTITALKLCEDGSVDYMTTDGPLPKDARGEWGSDGESFMLVLTRTFEHETTASTYSVTRVLKGAVEDKTGGYTTIGGEVKIGDISVGYFKAIGLPEDADKVRDSLEPKSVI